MACPIPAATSISKANLAWLPPCVCAYVRVNAFAYVRVNAFAYVRANAFVSGHLHGFHHITQGPRLVLCTISRHFKCRHPRFERLLLVQQLVTEMAHLIDHARHLCLHLLHLRLAQTCIHHENERMSKMLLITIIVSLPTNECELLSFSLFAWERYILIVFARCTPRETQPTAGRCAATPSSPRSRRRHRHPVFAVSCALILWPVLGREVAEMLSGGGSCSHAEPRYHPV